MIIRQVLPSALLSVLLLSAPPVLAAQQAVQMAAADKKGDDSKKQKEAKKEKDSKKEKESEETTKADVKAFSETKVSIADAISAATKQSGGTVIGAGFVARKGKPVYEVKTYQNNAVWEGLVDAQSGEVIGAGKTTPESQLDGEDKAELAGVPLATLTLAQAVDAAEKRDGGKAIKAELEETKGKIVYEIAIVKNGSLRKMEIDSVGGNILK